MLRATTSPGGSITNEILAYIIAAVLDELHVNHVIDGFELCIPTIVQVL